VARDVRDMRERREVFRFNSHLVSPIPPVSLGDLLGSPLLSWTREPWRAGTTKRNRILGTGLIEWPGSQRIVPSCVESFER